MINFCPMITIFGLITAATSVGGCYIHSASVVVIVGERVRLTCSTKEGSSITSWDIQVPIDSRRKTAVYAAPIYKRDGTVGTPEKVAEGYFVTRPADSETTLHVNKTILSQAGLYVCTCDLWSTAETTVVVLDSEPKFATDTSVTDGEPVTFNCSMSFNASSDVSCDISLKIEDASGSTVTVARRNESTENNGLRVCHLKHTIIANASSDQWPTCKVTLSNKGSGIIYSKVLNATVEWQPIRSAADSLPYGDVQAESGKETSQKLVIGLSVTIIAVVVIIIAVVAYLIIRSKDRDNMSTRQLSMGQPTNQSSNCPQRPANRYDKNKIGGEMPAAPAVSCHEDGYYAEEVVYNEVE